MLPLRLVLSIVVALVAVTGIAQQEQPKLGVKLQVAISNVDVVVTDHRGEPVRGLTASDFELVEGGERREITNFHEYRPGNVSADGSSTPEPEAIVQPRRIVVYLDEINLQPNERARLNDMLAELVGSLRAEDAMMIVAWRRGLKTLVPFTSDRQKLETAIAGGLPGVIDFDEANRSLLDSEIDWLIELSLAYASMGISFDLGANVAQSARSHAENRRLEVNRRAAALTQLVSAVGRRPGKKTMVLVSSHFSGNSLAATVAMPTSTDPLFNNSKVLSSIVDTANAFGVTIYAVSPRKMGFEMPSAADPTAGRLLDYSRKAVRPEAMKHDAMNAMNEIAGGTGGSIAYGPEDVGHLAQRIREDTESYYSIGYRTVTDGEDSKRKLTVRLKDRRNYTVRSRRSMVTKSAETHFRERVAANLMSPETAADFQIAASIGEIEEKRSQRLVPVAVLIPVAEIIGPDAAPGSIHPFVIGFASGEEHNVSGVTLQRHHFTVPAEGIANARRSAIAYKVQVATAVKTRAISIGVLREDNGAVALSGVLLPKRK